MEKGLPQPQRLNTLPMKCIICYQADLGEGLTSIPFERDEFRLLVRNVPALLCPYCGEALVTEEVALNLLGKAEHAFGQGLREDILEY